MMPRVCCCSLGFSGGQVAGWMLMLMPAAAPVVVVITAVSESLELTNEQEHTHYTTHLTKTPQQPHSHQATNTHPTVTDRNMDKTTTAVFGNYRICAF